MKTEEMNTKTKDEYRRITEKVKSHTIDKDDLTEIAGDIESLRTVFGDMLLEYFDRYDSGIERDWVYIARDFKHYRSYANLCFNTLLQINQKLSEMGIIG